VTGLAEESDGHVWVSSGASFAGAFHWDGQRWRRVRGPSSPNTPVHRIARDRRGHLWFLALGPAPAGLAPEEEPGAWVFDGRSFRHMGVEEGLLNGRVYAFAEDSIGGLWFGTYTGISRLRGGAWRHWTTRDGLREGKVFTLAVDLQNRVWFGHQHSGLGVIDSTDGIRYITRSDGLVGNSVWGLEVDDEGTLWVATRSGVSRLRGGIWSSFTELTGLNSPFTWALKARDRVLYVGTSGGGVNEFRYGQYTSPTPIVEIQEPVQRGRGMAFAWATFAAWGEIPPTAIETRYAVDEGPWSRWDRKRDLYLDSLPSGMHIFRVQAKGLLGAVRTPSTSIGFEVYPPLPLRPGFYVPVGVLLLLLVAGGGVGIARKRRYDRALRETARRIAAVLEAVEEGITLSDASGHFELFNSKFQKLTGYSVDEANADRDFLERLYPERSDLHRVLDAFHTLLSTRLPQEVEAQILRKDGVRRTLLVNMNLFEHNARGQFLSSYRDITERKQVEERLRVSLAEKEVLLKEIHHRVKNNMQVISSLLNLQLNLLDDEEMREILRESQNRIKSMALIHEGLYRSENLAGVDFATYVSQLARSVVRSYTTAPVELLLDVGNVQLSIDMAIPCGLILNELISNAMKYAFPGGRAGTVSVKVCRTDEGMVKLEVADNGVGLPPTLDIRESKSMGLQLVTTLVNQLGGTLDAVRGTGARFVISFQA
jgi:PAS domain S-box-containing protein